MTTQRELVYILIPVHNRKAITLKCLETLQQNGDLGRYYVVVIDDGSTDGTKEAIHHLYPEVTVLQGDGNLWWTGAIKMGMEYAYQQGAEYFIWLNDDCYPLKNSIPKLLDFCQTHPQTIVGGQCIDPDTFEPSYGGIITRLSNIVPVASSQNQQCICEGLNGNLVCFPSKVIKLITYPDNKRFPHYHGDTTYTHLAHRKGYNLVILGKALAHCKNDHHQLSWLIPEQSVSSLLSNYFNIKSAQYWKADLFYYIDMFGLKGIILYIYQKQFKFWLIILFVRPLPLSWRLKLKKVTSH